jgi:uncharacterized protein YbbC (DUF1343 family)
MNLMPIKSTYLFLFACLFFQFQSCAQKDKIESTSQIITGADQYAKYLPLLRDKNIAIVANQTSVVNTLQRKEVKPNVMGSEMVAIHLVDFLRSKRIKIDKVFAPEHGFRGKADAGEIVKDGVDPKTRIPVISLYGKNKKPTSEQLRLIDVIVFDIQDVGARFYTYISTLHYVMEAAAEQNIPVIVLDRPNPNGHYIDGPILEKKHKSFVGMHPVPVVYGMTIGEYGRMINGENWLENKVQCDLTVIPLKNYWHDRPYELPIKPSPNLPNAKSINLYPSLCFFEGTNVSAGRGTDMQFQIFGSPYLKRTEFSFTPQSNDGSKYPKHRGKLCYGQDLRNHPRLSQIHLRWLIESYQQTNTRGSFFNSFFTKLAGTKKLEIQISKGMSEEEIRKSWEPGLNDFKKIRSKYLIYK